MHESKRVWYLFNWPQLVCMFCVFFLLSLVAYVCLPNALCLCPVGLLVCQPGGEDCWSKQNTLNVSEKTLFALFLFGVFDCSRKKRYTNVWKNVKACSDVLTIEASIFEYPKGALCHMPVSCRLCHMPVGLLSCWPGGQACWPAPPPSHIVSK